MKLPKGKLLTLLAIFAAVGLVTATGAFTTVTAERTATVNIAGDSSAALALEPTNTENGDPAPAGGSEIGYATINDNNQLVVGTAKLSGTGANNAQGVNLNANTDVEKVFKITNQGTQEVAVSISASDDTSQGEGSGDSGSGEAAAVMFHHTVDDSISATTEQALAAPTGSTYSSNYESDEFNMTQPIELDPGESVTVSMRIDTSADVVTDTSAKNDDLIDTFTITADADAAANNDYTEKGGETSPD